MPGLGETIFDLTQARRLMEGVGQGAGVLSAVTPVGSNPGALAMFSYLPPGLPAGAPLVVVLHGCGQTAQGYDQASGWSALAARHGFALLYPEQTHANNANTCFHWFLPEDVTRGQGEVLSIKQMIDQMVSTHRLGASRVCITGLSAGGAMTSAMLATYPETFAGGAIIAGLPYMAASGMSGAFEAMRQLPERSPKAWGDLVRAASPYTGRRPPVQIWHGGADRVVRPAAFGELVKQWSDVLGVGDAATDTLDGVTHRVWRDGNDGTVLLESYFIDAMGHGTPLWTAADDLDESVGAAGPFMLEAGISSTLRIAKSWGLLTQASQLRAAQPRASQSAASRVISEPLTAVANVIDSALRAAGLKG